MSERKGQLEPEDLGLELIIDGPTEPLRLVESTDPMIDKSGKPVLATLDGPVMDYINPTRNVRLYEEELCDEVHDSEYVKEMEDTNNFFGEPDHPMRYQNRLDVHYPEVSHAIRNFRKVPEKGCYYATFDILDTPNGRILKTLLDYGAKLGVSSRGSGRTIVRNGQVVVDKRTYRFITFDIVHMPGNKIARLPNAANESVDPGLRTTLTEQVEQLIDSKDLTSLRSVKPVLDYLSESSDVGDLLSRVNEVLSADESNTITESATDDLLEAYSQIDALKKELEQRDSIISGLKSDSARLEEANQSLQNTNSELSEKLEKSSSLIKAHLIKERDARGLLESTQIKLNELQETYSSLQAELDSANRSSSMNESVVVSLKRTIESESEKSAQLVSRMQESLDQANADLESLTEQLHYSDTKYSGLLKEYFNLRCSQLGVDPQLLRKKLNENLSAYSTAELEDIIQDAYKHKPRRAAAPLVESTQVMRVGSSKLKSSVVTPPSSEQAELSMIRDSARAVRNQ